ncbi:MAG: HNH endonuclease signature motif containing protein [Pyrinomonadaceae bacterium]
MSWWIYKCNSQGRDYQRSYGDWKEFFDGGSDEEWGSTEWVPALSALKEGDMVLAYQTNRNELVGLAKVRQSCEVDSYLYLDPVEVVGVKVRPLKRLDSKIAEIPALKPGPIQTIYSISPSDARYLLEAAGAKYKGYGKEAKNSVVASSNLEPPKRISVQITRVVRDTAKTRRLKETYECYCQICNQRIEISQAKSYAEVHHIRPLGGGHKGLDDESNMIVVCPTHHAYFDFGVPRFLSAKKVKIGKEIFTLLSKHDLNKDNLDYHNEIIFDSNV